MSRVLTQAEKDALMGVRSQYERATSAYKPLEAPGVPPETNSGLAPTRTPPAGFCLSDRPRMPRGWINSVEGGKWLAARGEAFSKMRTGGQMNFGFLPKNQK